MYYIDQLFYDTEYKGSPIEAESFLVLEARASDMIDQETNYILKGIEFERLAQFIQDQVKKAVAAQVEFLYAQGGGLSVHGGSPSSVNIGNFSYSENPNSSNGTISPMVINYLKPIGLLYKGVSTYGY